MDKKNKTKDLQPSLFRDAMRDVKPIAQDKIHLKVKKKTPLKIQASKKNKYFSGGNFSLSINNLDLLSTEKLIKPEDRLIFARTGLQHKVVQQLSRGHFPIEAVLDLHRLTVEMASQAISIFLDKCISEHKRCVLIIHGKGSYSSNRKAILKNQVNLWLREHPMVLAFHSAQLKDGGTGAVYLLLKFE